VDLHKRAVLLVEDDFNIRRMYVLGLATAGYEVTAVGDADAALDAVATWQPDVAILDWDLPRMRGDELFDRLRRNAKTKQLPVMFLSNYRRSETRIAGAVMGGNTVPWLLKAETTPAQLAERVGRLLGSGDRHPTSPTAA